MSGPLPCSKAIGIVCHLVGQNWSLLKQAIGWEEAFKDYSEEAFLCSVTHLDPLWRQRATISAWQQNIWTSRKMDLSIKENNLSKNVYTVNLYVLRYVNLFPFLEFYYF